MDAVGELEFRAARQAGLLMTVSQRWDGLGFRLWRQHDEIL